jgi:type VI protein secretion system component VasK
LKIQSQNQPARQRGLTALEGALALIALLLVVQMWLLTATLELYLAGHGEVVLAAAIISGVLFLICAGLYLFVCRVDAAAREQSERTLAPPPQ